MTPLHIAAKNGYFEIALKLIYSQSLIDAKDIVKIF